MMKNGFFKSNGQKGFGWIECIIITGILLALGFHFNPSDPFFMHAPFPWIWFAPVLIALRYGTLQGLFSVIIIIAVFFTFTSHPWQAISNRIFLLSGLLLTLLCGAYQKIWERRMYYAEQIKDFIQDRIENISTSYNMLLFSHDRLEQSLISKPVTLRSALEQLRELLSNSSKELTSDIADRYLQQLAYYCSLDVAGLYLFRRDKLNSDPIAKIGRVKPFEKNDILVQQCLERRVTTYIAVNQLENDNRSNYLAVAPLQSSDKQLLGLLAVEEMPFLALNEDTLKTLAMLLTYFADSLLEKDIGEKLLKIFPSCPLQFAAELFKLKNLQQQVKVDSMVVCWYFSADPQRDNYIFKIEQERRGLDTLWRTKNKADEVLLILMPISDQSTIAGYQQRMITLLQEEFGVKIDQKTVAMGYRQISSYKNPITLIEELLEKK